MLALFLGTVWAGPARTPSRPVSPIVVVKIISFDCSVCYASENLDQPIRQAILDKGGRFLVAPLPRVETQVRERFYYTLRDTYPDLFKGTQDLNYPLTEISDTMDWLSQDVNDSRIDWDKIAVAVQAPEAGEPIKRAIALAYKAGAQLTPTYVLVRDGNVISTFDINSASNPSLSALRQAVLDALKQEPIAKD
jgi:hypothetical protein